MDGRLERHFTRVAAKRLAAVEVAAAKVSRQHEFNAERSVVAMLGDEERRFDSDYLYFGDSLEGGGFLQDEGLWIKYYDARRDKSHRVPEYRLYYPVSSISMAHAWIGDWCWIAKRVDGTLLIVVAQADTAVAHRLDRLFGTNLREPRTGAEDGKNFSLFDLTDADDDDLDLADADLLMTLGVTPEIHHVDHLAEMVRRFRGVYPLPPTKSFTAFTRSVCVTADPRDDPDRVLFDWVSTTNDLFFAYERHVLQPLLDSEFAGKEHIDVERFFQLATRYKNGRFSRAGASFEHHIAALFDAVGLRFARPKTMRDGSKPDFLLPSLDAYGDADTPEEVLTFLAAKTTTKERWRQVVTEASRIPVKHLITMDRELNAEVLYAMAENRVIPVVPTPIRASYPAGFAELILAVHEFVAMAQERQEASERLPLDTTFPETQITLDEYHPGGGKRGGERAGHIPDPKSTSAD